MIPLDRSRPLWDMHILNVKTSDAEAVGVIRSHHSLGDGTSLISLLLACTHKTSDPKDTVIPSLKRRETVSYGLRKQGWLLRLTFTVCSTARLLWKHTCRYVASFGDCLVFEGYKDTSKRRRRCREESKEILW